MPSIRYFSSANGLFRQIPENLKGRSKSSQEWLIRQLKDPYVEKAKMENYRCRSAFKLLEMNAKYNIFSSGMCVVDCGAAPGSWTQVAVNKVNANGKDSSKPCGFVVSIDRLPIHPIDGAVTVGGHDFTQSDSQTRIMDVLNGRRVDVVISDMAPNASGVKQSDHERILTLAYSVIRFGFGISREGGSVLIKLWEGGGTAKLVNDLQTFYSTVKRVKPPASRSDSSEVFILAKGFKGVQSVSQN